MVENKFSVAKRAAIPESVMIANPPRGVISKDDAIAFIAWLAVTSDITVADITAAMSTLAQEQKT